MKTDNGKLNKKQFDVVDELFLGNLEEYEIIEKYKLTKRLFHKWMADEVFVNEMESRIRSSRLKGRLLIARYASVAASKLVELTQDKKEETARKACVDIISLPIERARKKPTDHLDNEKGRQIIAPELAGKLLEVLAKGQKP
ncbi:MAG TPA: hypothetical protein ENH94_10210 [Phycisphaerales bacterium]|nr:hypothetical protein [Phycisphaerales bacterium]